MYMCVQVDIQYINIPDSNNTIPLYFPCSFSTSTLLGVLTHGELDNGRGRSRLKLFRHKHEVCSYMY